MGAVYLVRHGQAPAHAYGVGEADPAAPGLTELGFAQARRTGELLARLVPTFDAAISGDLPRQRATLFAVLEAFDERPAHEVDADWDEYALPASLMTTAADLYADRAAYQRVLDAGLNGWIAGTESGEETFVEFLARTRAAAQRAAALAGSGRNVLVTSSAGTIGLLIAQLWGIPPADWPAVSRTFVNASITKVLVGRSGLTVVSVNEHGHLAADRIATFR
ncbi:phosphoglycerate mutase [Gordonia spumicola]|uniref:Phosphoglycerate mutase n=1 Tax=Gordonia spumicola TaxID=589161 RepID=A0A7I9V8Q5_9ACTN|nr:histidine phosphatase family protein [Gordonia spumicola]GEE01624.1 phosphoglycerate mutase [Gordonia spumicola]